MTPKPRGRRLVLLKLGGSLITDKGREGVARPEVIRRLAGEIAAAGDAASRPGAPLLLLGHGSGSFGHAEAARHGVHRGLSGPPAAVSRVQERAAALHRLVVTALLDAGLAPFSIAPSSALVAAGGRPERLETGPLALALEAGFLPVVYGDVVLDREQGCAICSTETVLETAAAELSRRGFAPEHALWAGATEGVLDAGGRTIPEVRAADAAAALDAAEGAAGTDVTGGMRHRLEAALALAGRGIPSTVFDATVPGRLAAALRGEPLPGTRIVAG